MDKQETLADILDEIRSDEAASVLTTGLLAHEMKQQLNFWVDRIEAAAERRIASLNAALANCRRYAQKIERENDEGETRLDAEEIIATVDNAAKCIAQKALEGEQCSPPIAQESPKIEQPGNAAALRAALGNIRDIVRELADEVNQLEEVDLVCNTDRARRIEALFREARETLGDEL